MRPLLPILSLCISLPLLGCEPEFTQVSAGSYHTCAITPEQKIRCWGCDGEKYNAGQCAPPRGKFRQVSAGQYQSCAVATDGTVECWGCEEIDYSYGDHPYPRDVDWGQCRAPSGTYTQVAAGWRHTCAVASDGAVSCWGSAT